MKTKIILNTLLLTLLMFLILSCEYPSESIISKKLIIENGFYSFVEDPFSKEIEVKIEFDYYVTEGPCRIGSYYVKYDSNRMGMKFWYSPITLTPGKVYKEVGRILTSKVQETGPVILMNGNTNPYIEDVALHAEYTLKPKWKHNYNSVVKNPM